MPKQLDELIDGLNEDLANEYSAIIMYSHYASTVTGLYHQTLKPFFEDEIPDEQGHALYLSEKIKNLGGEPTTTPAPVHPVHDVKEMLMEARKAEKSTIKRYETRRKQALALELTELAVRLEDMISDETGHLEAMDRLLADPRFA